MDTLVVLFVIKISSLFFVPLYALSVKSVDFLDSRLK